MRKGTLKLAKRNPEKFAQSINKIVTQSLQQNPEMRIDFALQESKNNGNRYLNMRQFIKNDTYDGTTKNGFSMMVQDVEEIEQLQKAFNDFFEEAKKYF